ncbi:MAG TPA: M20/M25/M40 family metallo-hydrolase [Pirellulaceae bacterium]|nr:M20/M25/M40 family metallo-hydrolase [Pirellulaceae bacterium]
MPVQRISNKFTRATATAFVGLLCSYAPAQQASLEDSLWHYLRAVPVQGEQNEGENKFEFSERVNKEREKQLIEIIVGTQQSRGLLSNELDHREANDLPLSLHRHRVLKEGTRSTPELAVKNLVVKLGSGEKPTIVVGAHLDKVVEAGTGVIDDWSGAVLILHLCKALSRHRDFNHNFVFVCFAYEESGLWGSETFVNDLRVGDDTLTPLIGGLHNVKAMVNIECLGVSQLYGWKEGSTQELADVAEEVASEVGVDFTNRPIGLPVGADSVPFFFEGIPAITIDSLKAPEFEGDTSHDFGKIHTSQDKLSNIIKDRYVSTLGFATRYLVKLDHQLAGSRDSYDARRRSRPTPAEHPLVTYQSFGHHLHSRVSLESGASASFAPMSGSNVQRPGDCNSIRIVDGVVALRDSGEWWIVSVTDKGIRKTRLAEVR